MKHWRLKNSFRFSSLSNYGRIHYVRMFCTCRKWNNTEQACRPYLSVLLCVYLDLQNADLLGPAVTIELAEGLDGEGLDRERLERKGWKKFVLANQRNKTFRFTVPPAVAL